MYLFFDTETTGLPRSWKASITDSNNWPRLVQIAWLVFDLDGNRVDTQEFIIKPEDFTIPEDASRVHGISTEQALSDGLPLQEVLNDFQNFIAEASYLVAHNINFDEKIVGAEFIRNNMTNSIASKNKICTMEKATNYCEIPGPYGYKWPKLSELHYKLFGTGFEEAHNAEVDINATAKCFWEMKKRELL